MFQLGKKQTLIVVKELSFGVYLAEQPDAGMDDRVLLPKKQVPPDCKIGDQMEVFLYKDSKDRIIAARSEDYGFLKLRISVRFWTGGLKKIFCFRIRSRQANSMRVMKFLSQFMSIRAVALQQP